MFNALRSGFSGIGWFSRMPTSEPSDEVQPISVEFNGHSFDILSSVAWIDTYKIDDTSKPLYQAFNTLYQDFLKEVYTAEERGTMGEKECSIKTLQNKEYFTSENDKYKGKVEVYVLVYSGETPTIKLEYRNEHGNIQNLKVSKGQPIAFVSAQHLRMNHKYRSQTNPKFHDIVYISEIMKYPGLIGSAAKLLYESLYNEGGPWGKSFIFLEVNLKAEGVEKLRNMYIDRGFVPSNLLFLKDRLEEAGSVPKERMEEMDSIRVFLESARTARQASHKLGYAINPALNDGEAGKRIVLLHKDDDKLENTRHILIYFPFINIEIVKKLDEIEEVPLAPSARESSPQYVLSRSSSGPQSIRSAAMRNSAPSAAGDIVHKKYLNSRSLAQEDDRMLALLQEKEGANGFDFLLPRSQPKGLYVARRRPAARKAPLPKPPKVDRIQEASLQRKRKLADEDQPILNSDSLAMGVEADVGGAALHYISGLGQDAVSMQEEQSVQIDSDDDDDDTNETIDERKRKLLGNASPTKKTELEHAFENQEKTIRGQTGSQKTYTILGNKWNNRWDIERIVYKEIPGGTVTVVEFVVRISDITNGNLIDKTSQVRVNTFVYNCYIFQRRLTLAIKRYVKDHGWGRRAEEYGVFSTMKKIMDDKDRWREFKKDMETKPFILEKKSTDGSKENIKFFKL